MSEVLHEEDGVTHINTWSQGKTAQGRWMSNFANTPFRHPEYGHFAGVEAFWYWLATGKQHDYLRRLYGASAKSAGSKQARVEVPEAEFRAEIARVLRMKLEQADDKIQRSFARSTLPFEHYFVFGAGKAVLVGREKHRWQMEIWEGLRDEWRVKQELPILPHRVAKETKKEEP